MNDLDYYLTQSKFTDPGEYSYLFDNLPDSIQAICESVHNVIVHEDDTEDLYGFKVSNEQAQQANSRYIKDILKIIVNNENAALNKQRDPQKRFLGVCRDFAALTCSILRHKKIPARARCGFSKYFHSDWYSDHWICEYYDKVEQRWKFADAELGKEEVKKYGINFDPTDISRDLFLVAGKAWIEARDGKLDPNICGMQDSGVHGLWFIKGDMIKDLASLNKIELLAWDYNDYSDNPFKNIKELSKDEIQLLDHVADITSKEPVVLNEILDVYNKNPKLQITNKIRSYFRGQRNLIGLQ